jgi:hypothetical protein
MGYNDLLPATEIFKVESAANNIGPVINDVFQGKIIGCEITDFFHPMHCKQLVDAVEKYEMDESYLSGTAKKVLESQHNRQSDPAAYFAGANSHPLLKEEVFKYSKRKLLSVLGKDYSGYPVSIAYDAERRSYYCPAIIREFHSKLKLHNDLGSREGVGWDPIKHINKQWAFVVKLTQCIGGQTYVYNKKWDESHQVYFNSDDNYSYDMKVVEGCTEIKVAGLKGSLIFFESTHYHRVDKVLKGRRYTMGGFVGLLEDRNELIVWA